MKMLYVPIGLAWLCCFLGGRVNQDPALASAVTATSAEITFAPDALQRGPIGATPVEPEDYQESHVDVRGNDVENALGDYRIDLGGAVYERHSPETLIPKLAPPSS